MSLSAVAVCDIKVARIELEEVRRDRKPDSIVRFLAALKKQAQGRVIAWQVYNATKRAAKRAGLI
jgi:hypothetical protein